MGPAGTIAHDGIGSVFSLLGEDEAEGAKIVKRGTVTRPPTGEYVKLGSNSTPHVVSVNRRERGDTANVDRTILQFELPGIDVLLPHRTSLVRDETAGDVVAALAIAVLGPCLSIATAFYAVT